MCITTRIIGLFSWILTLWASAAFLAFSAVFLPCSSALRSIFSIFALNSGELILASSALRALSSASRSILAIFALNSGELILASSALRASFLRFAFYFFNLCFEFRGIIISLDFGCIILYFLDMCLKFRRIIFCLDFSCIILYFLII